MDAFLLKKMIAGLLMPLPVISLLMLLGILALFKGKLPLAGGLIGSSFTLLLLLSTPWLPNALLETMEQHYPQYDQAKVVDTIVVLGCNHANDARLPITGQLDSCSMTRVAEAARIHRLQRKSHIITSGATLHEPFSNALMNKRMLMALGVAEENITAVAKSLDTEDESINLAPLLVGKTFVLVTSASHMPRAMQWFKRQNLNPIAAPTDHLVKHPSDGGTWRNILPNSKNLQKSERWWYEYLGQQWLHLKAWLFD